MLRSRALFTCVVLGFAFVHCGGDGSSGAGSGGASGDGETGGALGAGGGATSASTSSTATSSTGAGGLGQGGAASAAATGSGGAGGVDAAVPEAPLMKSVMSMSGALHVSWSNVTPDCDKVLLDRKQDDEAYALAYTLSGKAESHHDSAANVGTSTYCYKARCEKGGVASVDSNEKCGSP